MTTDAIPGTLRERPQWCTWRLEVDPERPERPKKVCKNVRTGGNAQSNNPATWAPYDQAVRARVARGHDGVGFFFDDADGLVGVDLDGCLDPATGGVAEWARGWLARMAAAGYCEVSPSGRGVKCVLRGEIPRSRKLSLGEHQGVEVYARRGRWFAITGHRWADAQGEPGDGQAVLDDLLAWIERMRRAPASPAEPAPPAPADYVAREHEPPLSDDWRAVRRHAVAVGVQEWVAGRIAYARQQVASAPSGSRHNARYDMARLLGGVVAAAPAYLTEREAFDAIYGARRPESHDTAERKAISDGLAEGLASPLTSPRPPTDQEIELRGERAHCPSCGARILRSKYDYPGTTTPGWYCPECKHPMVWPLSAYTPTGPPDAPAEGSPPPSGEGAYNHTDLGNARRLIAHQGHDLRYVPAWGAWLAWNGQHWERDEDGAVQRRARQTVADMYAEAATLDDPDRRKALARWAAKSESRGRLESMVALAQAEAGTPVGHEQLNAAPYLLAVANGTIDLRTGELLPHNRAHLITKALPYAYDPAAACPSWESFLGRVLGGDAELIQFVHRAVGYTLTADTREQCLFFLYGTGRNGKSTFVETLLELLGPYGQKAPTEMLMARPLGGGIPNDVAQLPGVRIVVTAETEEGRRLNESLVKDLTGGDRLTARFMRAEFFSFRPTHKLWMYGNHKPVIRGTDNGIWRRIRAIPFTVTIPDAEVDLDLPARLRAEMPGILAWAVAGCRAWQKLGLGSSSAVDEATRTYRAEMDVLGAFLDARCTIHPLARVGATALYRAYKEWAEESGEFVMSQRRFGGQVTERGFGQVKDSMGIIHRTGIGLLSSRPPPPGPPPEDPQSDGRRMYGGTEDDGGLSIYTHMRDPTPLSCSLLDHPPSSSVPPESSVEREQASTPTAQAVAERLRARKEHREA